VLAIYPAIDDSLPFVVFIEFWPQVALSMTTTPESPMINNPELPTSALPIYHPSFAAPDADIPLRSSDGTHFRIYSTVLRTTCDFFTQMLSLPQGNLESTEDVIALDEKAVVLEKLLRLISGLEIPRWESYEDVESVLSAADKYGAAGAVSLIRSAITAPRFLEEPLRLYTLAARFNWEDELNLAAKLTLTLSIYDDAYDSILAKIPSFHLHKLMKLHHRRKAQFRHTLDTDAQLTQFNAPKRNCPGCTRDIYNHPWQGLKAALCRELDRRPLGDTVPAAELWARSEVTAYRDARCQCGRLCCKWDMILVFLEECVADLPLTL